MSVMVFKETSVFTRQISKLIPDEAYRELQQELNLQSNGWRRDQRERRPSKNPMALRCRRKAWRDQGNILLVCS